MADAIPLRAIGNGRHATELRSTPHEPRRLSGRAFARSDDSAGCAMRFTQPAALRERPA
jgi:hypothetical protein